MSADQTVYEILKEYYSRPGQLPQADGLYPLFIADMDSVGRQSEGLGWNELGDPERHVPMVASLPEVVREGDILRLFWTTTRPGSQPPISNPTETEVDRYVLNQEVVDRRVLSFATKSGALDLPADIADRPDFLGFLYYSLEDGLNGGTRYSPYREVLIDLTVPGGLDPDMSTPINENLAAPVVSPSPINDATVEVRVSIAPWIGQQVGDQVTVLWNGVRYVYPLRLTVGDIGKPLEIPVPEEVLLAGGDGFDLPVQYEIRDRVQNYSRPSPAALVDVAIDPDALAEPEVENTEDPDFVFDLDAHTGQTVRVTTLYTQFRRGDRVQLFVFATTSDSVEVPYESEIKTVNALGNLFFNVPRVFFAFAANGATRLYYKSTAAAAGSVTRTSRTRRVRVVSTVVALLPPVLVEANGTDTVDLADVTTGTFNVRIPLYPGQMVGDQVRLTLSGRPSEGLPLVSFVDAAVAGEQTALEIPVTALLLRALLDGTVSLSYTVTNTALGLPPRRSTNDPTYFVVDRNVPAFPPLTCEQVVGAGAGAYLPTITPFADFVVPEEARLTLGQVVTFRLEVANSTTPTPYTQSIVFAGFPLDFIVSNSVIKRFDELDVQATYSVPR